MFRVSFHTHSKSHQEHRLLPWGLGAPAVHLAEQAPDGGLQSAQLWTVDWMVNGDRRGPVMVTVLGPGPGEEPTSDRAGPLGGWWGGRGERMRAYFPLCWVQGCSAAEHGASQPLCRPPRLQLWHLGFIFSHS